MRIRAAVEGDAEAIAGIHVRGWQAGYRGLMPDAYLDGLDPAEWRERHRGRIAMPEPGMRRWVAETEDGSVAGFAVAGPARALENEAGEIYAIYVEPSERRRGIGRALLEHAAQVMRGEGYRQGTLWVLRDNGPARRFYESLGWSPDGAEKGFELPGLERVVVPEVRYVREL